MASPEPDLFLQEAFLSNAGALFELLSTSVVWDTRIAARKTATFGKPYSYSGITYDEQSLTLELADVADKIASCIKGFAPNNCLLNYYETGAATMGFHSDSTEELAPGTGVAIVSLGAERPLVFRSVTDKSVEFAYPLPSGSLLYMGTDVQAHWRHAVKKVPELSEGRISLTFRQIV